MASPATRYPWTARLGTVATFLSNGIVMGAWVGSLPRLREAAGLNDAGLGLLLLALSVGAVSSMPGVTLLVRRYGARRIALLGGVLQGLALPAMAVASGWPALVAAGVALGMVMASMDVAMNTHASEVERRWGLPIMSSFHAAWSMGGLAGSAATGALAAAGWSLGGCLAAGGGAAMLLGLCGGVFGGRGMPAAVREAAAPATSRFAPPRLRMPSRVMPSRVMRGACALAMVCFVTEGAVGDWGGIYLRTVLGASLATATGAYSAFAATMAVCRLFGDLIVRRLGPMRVVQLGGLLAAAGIAAALMLPSVPGASLAFALVGVGLANVVPVIFSAAGRLGGAAGMATIASVGYGGLLAGPPVFGFVAQGLGLPVALASLAAGGLLVAALAPSVANDPRSRTAEA